MSRTTAFGDSSGSSTQGCPAGRWRGPPEELGERLGPADVLQQLHPLLVLDALGLHRGDGLAPGLVLLRVEHGAGVVEGRLDDRQHVERVGRRLAVEQVDRGEHEGRERLVEREVQLEVADDPHDPAVRVRLGQPLDDPGRRAAPGRCAIARRMWRRWRRRGSWLSSSRCRIAANASPGREMTLSSIAWVTRNWLVSASGWADCSFSKLVSDQQTKPSGGFLRTIRRFLPRRPRPWRAAARSPPRGRAPPTTTVPTVSYPARPARPAIWWNSRALSGRVRWPSNLDSAVNSTVRIGTLMPTPRVSVPQITLSSPACASVSTRRR